MNFNFTEIPYRSCFFVGIGGIGMSALAFYLHTKGYIIHGSSDDLNQETIMLLQQHNIPIFKESDTINALKEIAIDCFILTNTIKLNSPIVLYAKEHNIPIMYRGELLGEILNNTRMIAVTGSHGKTTTTGMIGHVLYTGKGNPTIFIGGILQTIESNVHIGSPNFVVVEADDAYKSFLALKPYISVINNISYEHLETYTSWDDIEKTYLQFMNNTHEDGYVVVNIDDERINKIYKKCEKTIFTVSAKDQTADLYIKRITLEENYSELTFYRNDKNGNTLEIDYLRVTMPGIHNAYNAAMATAALYCLGLTLERITELFCFYHGVKRRFELIGTSKNKVDLYDDYAHHPKEIDALLTAICNKWKKEKIIIFWQPHKYSRTKFLWNDFIDVLTKHTVTQFFITDVFAAGDEYDNEYNSESLTKACNVKKNQFTYVPFDAEFKAISSKFMGNNVRKAMGQPLSK